MCEKIKFSQKNRWYNIMFAGTWKFGGPVINGNDKGELWSRDVTLEVGSRQPGCLPPGGRPHCPPADSVPAPALLHGHRIHTSRECSPHIVIWPIPMHAIIPDLSSNCCTIHESIPIAPPIECRRGAPSSSMRWTMRPSPWSRFTMRSK